MENAIKKGCIGVYRGKSSSRSSKRIELQFLQGPLFSPVSGGPGVVWLRIIHVYSGAGEEETRP